MRREPPVGAQPSSPTTGLEGGTYAVVVDYEQAAKTRGPFSNCQPFPKVGTLTRVKMQNSSN